MRTSYFVQLKAVICDPDWIRTNDPQLRRLMLYPTELPDQFCRAKLINFYIAANCIIHGCKN